MTPADEARRRRTHEMLNGPMSVQCLRLHVFQRAPGVIDGCAAIHLSEVDGNDLLAYAIELRRLARSVEGGMIQTLAEAAGTTPEVMSAFCDKAAAMMTDHDSDQVVRYLGKPEARKTQSG